MPSCSKATNPQGIEITFTEEDHSYISTINGQTIKYLSGTGFVGKFFKPFDPTGEITKRCALKEGISVEEIKARWAAKGKASCIFGTRVHETCEDTILNRPLRNTPQNEKEIATFDNAIKIATKFRDKLEILGVEKIVFNHLLPTPIAGTIDLLARSKTDGTVLILDWKTNQSIEKENKYNNFALDPIAHIDDTTFMHYALQTSLYQFIMEYGHYFPIGTKYKRALIHLTEQKYEIMQLPDLTTEIRDMIIFNAK